MARTKNAASNHRQRHSAAADGDDPMAVDIFLDIEGIKGESKDSKHKDTIDVLSWSWGMSQSGTAHMGGGAGAGKVSVQDINFTHYLDKSSPTLMLHCCNGKHI